ISGHFGIESGARRSRPTKSLWIVCESDSSKLPAFFRLKEIAIGAPDMTARRSTGTAAQNVLVAHELAVVFAERTQCRAVTGIRRVSAARPLPNVAKHLVKLAILRGFIR